MSQASKNTAAPQRILLATDLSARCDRALDRSVQLARQWGSELVALTAVEHVESMPDLTVDWIAHHGTHAQADLAQRVLSRELRRHGDLRTSIELVVGDVVEGIRSRTVALACPFVVTGVARDEPFGRMFTGTTTEALARSGPPLLLVVRERPHEPYRRVLVASDFSQPSQQALEVALRLWPEAKIVLYHAYESPYAGIAGRSAQGRTARTHGVHEAQAFLDRCGLAAEDRARIRVVVESGAVELAASRYVRDHGIQLAVAGNRGISGIGDLLLGSSAAKLLQWVPCDLLLVRATG